MIMTITFDAAVELNKIEDADAYPYAVLNSTGQSKVKEFADSFYADGEDDDDPVYDESAVFSKFEQDAECLLRGEDHIVELSRVNRGMFGGFKVDTLRMEPADFDWMINE